MELNSRRTINKQMYQTSYDDLSGSGMVIRQKQLEMENKWLRNMLLEKNGKGGSEGLRKTHNSDLSDREVSERTDGVGTKTDT